MKTACGSNTNGPSTTKLVTANKTYTGMDVLEGFANDAEELGKLEEYDKNYDNKFYRLCKMENMYIFDFDDSDSVKDEY